MNELIKVTYNEDRITVSARDLHEFLELTERFSVWFERMLKYGFEENIDFTGVRKLTAVNNGAKQELQDFQLTSEMAKEISMIQRNEKGSKARKYFIECEKQVQQPKSMEDIMIYQLKEMKRLREQAEQATSIALETKDELQQMRDTINLSPSSWRKGASSIITRIAQKLGGNEYIHTVREESYKYLEERAHVALNIRLSNKKRTMAENGVCKSKRDKLNKLDIIAEDPKVLECYLAIVKEMAIKYGVSGSDHLVVSQESSMRATA